MVDFADYVGAVQPIPDGNETQLCAVDCTQATEVAGIIILDGWLAVSLAADTTGVTLSIVRNDNTGRVVATATYDAAPSTDAAHGAEFSVQGFDGPGVIGDPEYVLQATVVGASSPSPVFGVELHARYNYVPPQVNSG